MLQSIADASQCKPEFPPAALRAETTGTTTVRFNIDAAGRVAGAEVVKSSGPSREHRLLDRAAVTALSECKFTPGRDADGRAVGASFNVEYVWRLQ